jgi:hypothetical protein
MTPVLCDLIELRADNIAQLFHILGPFPFRERDLNKEGKLCGDRPSCRFRSRGATTCLDRLQPGYDAACNGTHFSPRLT